MSHYQLADNEIDTSNDWNIALHIVHGCALLAKLIAPLLASLCLVAVCVAEDLPNPFVPKPAEKIEEPEPGSQEGESTAPQDAGAPRVDPRPVVDALLSKERHCPPCDAFVRWLEKNGDTFGIRFNVLRDDRHFHTGSVPRFVCPDKPTHTFEGFNDKTPPLLLNWWKAQHAGEELPVYEVPVPKASGNQAKDFIEQFRLFAGDSGKLSIQPDKPIVAELEDGTMVKYSRINAKWRMVNGQPVVTFGEPLPAVSVLKWRFRISASILDAGFEPPAAVRVGTSKGRYRISLTEEGDE